MNDWWFMLALLFQNLQKKEGKPIFIVSVGRSWSNFLLSWWCGGKDSSGGGEIEVGVVKVEVEVVVVVVVVVHSCCSQSRSSRSSLSQHGSPGSSPIIGLLSYSFSLRKALWSNRIFCCCWSLVITIDILGFAIGGLVEEDYCTIEKGLQKP